MTYLIKAENIEKISLFDNTVKKWSLTKIKQRTGCTSIINGGLFNMSTMKPVTHLKIDGIVKSKDEYKYWGYAFNTNSKNFDIVNDYALYDNYFCCVCLVKDGNKTTLTYNSDMGGSRGRTAIAKNKNGDIVIYCSKDGTSGAKTPEQLQDYFINMGVDSAIMLDSGGSSQCSLNDSKNSTVTSSRIVSNLILIWEKDKGELVENNDKEAESEKEVVVESNNVGVDMPNFNDADMWKPVYSEPTTDTKVGAKNDGVKWIQSMLQKIGFVLEVDGDFGGDTSSAVLRFQKYWSLTQNGVVNSATRNALKECVWGITASKVNIIRTAMPEICRNEADAQDDKYILWYNNANKTTFATTVAWCAIFVSWCMRRSGLNSTTYPNYASCSAGWNTFKNKGVTRSSSAYSPKSGDIIFFDFNKDGLPEHTGLVFANDGNYIYTIEGNSSDAVKHNKYARTNTSIFGYVET